MVPSLPPMVLMPTRLSDHYKTLSNFETELMGTLPLVFFFYEFDIHGVLTGVSLDEREGNGVQKFHFHQKARDLQVATSEAGSSSLRPPFGTLNRDADRFIVSSFSYVFCMEYPPHYTLGFHICFYNLRDTRWPSRLPTSTVEGIFIWGFGGFGIAWWNGNTGGLGHAFNTQASCRLLVWHVATEPAQLVLFISSEYLSQFVAEARFAAGSFVL